MVKSLSLPFIELEESNGKKQAIAAWKLASVLSIDLAISQFLPKVSDDNQSEEKYLFLSFLHSNRSSFARAISSWPDNVIVELNMVSIPHLESKFKGKVQYYFLLRVLGETKKKVLASAFKYATMFQGLLNSCFPEVEFSPVRTPEGLKNICEPFKPRSATLVLRRQEQIHMAESLVRNRVGFVVPPGRYFLKDPTTTYTFPWVPNPFGHERLIHYLLWSTYPVWISSKIRASKNVAKETERMRKLVEECDGYLTGSVTSRQVYEYQLSVIQKILFKRSLELATKALQAQITVFTLNEPDTTLLCMVGESVGGKPANRDNGTFSRFGFRLESVKVEKALNPLYFHEKESFTTDEVIPVLQIPYPPRNDFPGITIKCFRSAFADVSREIAHEPDSIILGINTHRGIQQPIYCRMKDRLRHTFIIGMTGTGKSTFMENLILQDIKNDHGLCLVDPHGELIEQIIGKIPREREKDVVLFDPLDQEYSVGFNLLEWKTIEERDLIIDNLYQTLDQIYDMKNTGGPIFEQNFRNMLKLLMGDHHEDDFLPTLLHFPILYLSETFRNFLKNRIKDNVVKSFLDELEGATGDMRISSISPYITSKFGRFTNDTILRRIIGQGRSTIDIDEILDSGKILLVNLGKGRFGSTVSSLLTSQIITRFKNAAMRRAEVPEDARRPFFLYVDEFQNVSSSEFAELLAEARKYGLGLILANQFTGQIDKRDNNGESVLNAILGNVGTFVVFRVGIKDATRLEPIFYPHFRDLDLKELPNWQAYVQLRPEGKVIPPFNIQTVLNKSEYNQQVAERVRHASRVKYARPVHEVEEKIAEMLEFLTALNYLE